MLCTEVRQRSISNPIDTAKDGHSITGITGSVHPSHQSILRSARRFRPAHLSADLRDDGLWSVVVTPQITHVSRPQVTSVGSNNTPGCRASQPWANEDLAQFASLLRAAYDRGLNTWDTANVYSAGLNESAIGDFLSQNHTVIPRRKITLLTKVYGYVGEDPSVDEMDHADALRWQSKDYINQGGLSRAAIFTAVEASLSRLQTSYIDVLQIHRFDPTVPVDETMKALHDLVAGGKVRYVGASSMWTYQFANMQHVAEKNGWTKFISMQNCYSLLYREEEREMMRFCGETGVGVIPYSPLGRGYLARPYQRIAGEGQGRSARETFYKAMKRDLPEVDVEIIGRVEELAAKKGWSMAQVGLLWIVAKGATPIVGVNSVTQLDDVCGIRGKKLSGEEVKWLEELYKPKEVMGHV